MASVYELIVKAVDQTKTPLRGIERNLDRLDKQAKTVGISMRGIGTAIAAFATGATVRNIVQTTARFEDFRDTLASVTGSVEQGSRAFEGIQKFATQTQFGVEELTTTYIKLAGAGIKPTTKLLTTFTDTAAVTTDQLGTLQAITDLFSRTTSGGLGLEELNRLADRGVPVFKILEEQLGLTRLEISEFGKTAAGANKITEALQKGLDQRFGGATQNKLDNLSTSMSNFGIAVTNAAARLGDRFRPQLTAAINDATKFLEKNDQLIEALGDGLGKAIVNSSRALGVIAENFDAIKNAAIVLIGLRIAGFFGTLASRLSSAIAPAKTMSGILSGLGKAAASGVARIPILGAAFVTLGSIVGKIGPALLNPFIGIPVAVAAAVTGGLVYFQDSMVQVGNTTASVGEVTRAVFSLIGDQIQKVTSYLGERFNKALTSIGNFFNNYMLQPASEAFNGVLDIAKRALNFVVNSFVVSFEYIRGIVFNLPEFFIGAFKAVMNIAADFSGALTQKFSNLGDAIALAFKGDFEGAMNMAGKDVGYSFSESLQKALNEVPPVIPDVDVESIMKVDRVAQGIEAVKSSVATAISVTGEYISKVMDPLEAAIEKKIQNDRAEQTSVKEVTDKLKEQAVTLDEVNLKTSENAVVTKKAADETLTYAKYLEDVVKKGFEDARLTEYQARAKADLDAMLKAGTITLDAYAEIMERLYPTQKKDLTVTEQTIEALKQKNAEIDELKKSLGDVSVLAKQAGVDEADLQKALQDRLKTLTEVGEKSKTIADEINDAFKRAGDGLARDLARGLASGKASLSSFKDFFNRILEDILAAVIQKNITGPLVAGITGGPGGGIGGSLGNLFGTPTVGAPMGGLDFGGIGDFFSGLFRANGGRVGAGRGYIVGERGPEMFVPRTNGSVVPNDALNIGGGETVVNFNISAIDTQTGVEFLLKNKPQIIGMVTQAQNQRGRQGITA